MGKFVHGDLSGTPQLTSDGEALAQAILGALDACAGGNVQLVFRDRTTKDKIRDFARRNIRNPNDAYASGRLHDTDKISIRGTTLEFVVEQPGVKAEPFPTDGTDRTSIPHLFGEAK